MSTMVREFYEAFLEAGASKEKASRAAEVASSFVRADDGTLATRGDIHSLKDELKEDIGELDTRLEVVEAELRMVKWIVSGAGFGIIVLMIESFLPFLR